MSSHLFILGRKSDLCFAELFRVLSALHPGTTLERVLEHVAVVDGLEDQQVVALQGRLGGTLKVAHVISAGTPVDSERIEELTSDLLVTLVKEGSHSITFGMGEYGRESLDAPNLTRIKKLLREKGISSRFVDSPRSGLSASVLLHQDVEEAIVAKSQTTLYLGYTIGVQNIDDWTIRDREKPRADKKRGMLPPKLARQMLNLAVPGTEKKTILDPFCGTGTVLLEAVMLGHKALGSDIRRDAVEQTLENIAWLKKRYGIEAEADAFMADATHLTPKELGTTVDAIVAEGFLGPLTPNARELPNIFRGLEKLYKGTFKQWTQILNPGSVICLALPRVEIGKQVFSLGKFIDSTSEFGYNTLLEPQIYDRPEAVVKREIFLLEYKKI
jgi:tRNA G10  N-methylase Trm11